MPRRRRRLRLTKLAEEYHNRTGWFLRHFTRPICRFTSIAWKANTSTPADPKAPAGTSTARSSSLSATTKRTVDPWHTIQHEGFHQFASAVARHGELPVWVNEGLAEYFGEAVFTGDSYVTGLIPPERAARVKEMIKTDQYVSITKMMAMSHGEWNAALAAVNYDQAWSMVHFLAHGENGKYQGAFSNFIQLLSRGQLPDRAWDTTFGNPAGFEDRWKEYWLKLPLNATEDGYNRVRVFRRSPHSSRARRLRSSRSRRSRSFPKPRRSAACICPRTTGCRRTCCGMCWTTASARGRGCWNRQGRISRG